MNEPLVKMTHVCQSWRNVLLSTPSLWTQIDFSFYKSKQAIEGFLGRSGDQLLDVRLFLSDEKDAESCLPSTLDNIHRIRWLKIVSFHPHFDRVLESFASSAPELECLAIVNNLTAASEETKLPRIFGGRLPKLAYLSLNHLDTDLRDFDFPSLTRFVFTRTTKISVRDLASFLERCPLLEFAGISLPYTPEPPIPPPKSRVRLAALKELRFDQTASTCGLLDHLILPKCTEMTLKGLFTGEEIDWAGYPAARIHPSSIDYLPVTREITKAAAMPNSCILSGPNGNLRFWSFDLTRGRFDAWYFTSFSPIFVLEIRELWVGQNGATRAPWNQTVAGARGAFGVLTKVEDLTIVSCETGPLFATLGAIAGDCVLLPGLRRLTIYVGFGDVEVPTLVQCAKARKKHSRPLGKVTVIFEEEPGADFVGELESLRAFVGELVYSVGVTPRLFWETTDCSQW